MGFSYSLPVVGQPHSTEDPKVGTALTTLSTWGNGQIVDTDLNSPNNSVRRLLQAVNINVNGGQAGGTYVIGNGTLTAAGATFASPIPLWFGDSGLSSQPTDFQVANKSAFARVRVSITTNTVATTANFTFGLTPITAVGGSGGLQTLTLGTTAGSIAVNAPAASSALGAESAQFALPTAASCYVLTLVLSGATAANSLLLATVQIYGYNA